MSIPEVLAAFVVVMSSWGALWFRVGQLASEVREHNLKLDNIQKQLEHIITSRR